MIQPEQIAGKSILAFWDKDIPYLKHTLSTLKQDIVLAPMESNALRVFPGKNSCFFLPDCLLSPKEIDKINLKGKAILSDWVKNCGEYSWAAYASCNLLAILPSLFAAEALSHALCRHKIKEFYCIIPPNPSTWLEQYSPDIPRFAFKDTLSDKFRGIYITERQKQILNPSPVSSKTSEWDQTSYNYTQIADSSLFIIYHIDIYRFRKIIEDVKKEGKKVVILLYTGTIKDAQQASELYNVPVLLKPENNVVSLDAQDGQEFQLLTQFLAKFPNAGKLILSGLANRYFFLKNLYTAMRYLFNQYRPEQVFVSYGQADGFRVMEKAVEDSNIPLFNIMHGTYMNFMHTPIHKTGVMLTSCELSKKTLLKIQPTQKIIISEAIQAKHEYEMNEVQGTFEKPLILVVQSISQLYPSLRYYDGIHGRIKNLTELLSVPTSLTGKVAIRCKSHPDSFEKELYKKVPVDQSCFLPKLSNLEKLLDKAAIIVGLNYCGSPVLQGIERKIPAIVYHTALETTFDGGGFSEELRKSGIPFFNNVSDVWDTIDKLLFNETYRREAIKNQDAIRRDLII